MAGAYKTPGVYIVEKNAFPNSVVEVATAVPAFIGYTEKADNKGKSLAGKPWRITSMAEYVSYFGGPPPATFSIKRKEPKNGAGPNTDGVSDELKAAREAVAAIPAIAKSEDVFGSAEEDFSFGGTQFFLKRETTAFLMYRSMQMFFQNGGGACYIVSVGTYDDELKAAALSEGLEALKKEQEPTMVLTPDVVALAQDECYAVQQAVISHCGYDMKSRFAIVDVHGGYLDNRENECISKFRDGLATNFPAFAAAYYPWLNTTVVPLTDLSFANIHPDSRAAFADLLTLEVRESGAPAAKQASIIAEIEKVKTAADNDEVLHKTLNAVCPLYKNILSGVQAKLNLLPPSGAMAGIYTMVDNTRGVWKAPANVSVSATSSPTVNINHEEQEDLNVHTAGKSINAIRSFIGEGTLVWGARTLDGNSLDWRYINVRRTMIMLEESVKLATKAYVFEPNTANTWVTIKSMITNFLTSVWKRGGLAGASPEDAFSVSVGLGETMTAEDILEGILRVTVLVAISRPAEFIEITFQQQMQKS